MKSRKRLSLSKETLRFLSTKDLNGAAGGAGSARICPLYPDPGSGSGGSGPVHTGPFDSCNSCNTDPARSCTCP